MRISVIGCGYLGAVHAASMAKIGHQVVGIDVDGAKVAQLQAGQAPFHEPGFDEILAAGLQSGRLSFTTDYARARTAQVHFIGVGTPQLPDSGGADLHYVNAALESLLPQLDPEIAPVVVGKSTVPVGTAARLAPAVRSAGGSLIWNPEFLREGFAVQDTLEPDRIVYGLPPDPADAEHATAVLDEVYAPILTDDRPRLLVDYATAELVKVAANSFLATKISFINAMAELCEASGGDVVKLADAIGMDARIGRRFLNAGVGFGGGCLPKDIRAFMARAGELNAAQALTFLREVDTINQRRREHAVNLARRAVGGSLAGKHIAVLGAAFKPNSDDIRDSPALDIAHRLVGEGADVCVTDPAALPVVRKHRPWFLVADTAADAARDADLTMLLTEWRQYIDLDPVEFGIYVKHKKIIDGRNVLDPAQWRKSGWQYLGIGRP